MSGPAILPPAVIRWAVAVKRSAASCPLCATAARRCHCTVRELAEFRARQATLPGIEEHVAPAMPAATGGQGRLF